MTMQSLRSLLEALVTEKPTEIQSCLELLEMWLNSRNDHERERAMWCATCLLGFTVKMNNFQVETPFPRLGHLVRMLAMHCQDPVDGVRSLAAEAVYNLYRILLLQKQMTRETQGPLEGEGTSEAYSPHSFYDNTIQIGKVFAEYFTEIQLCDLVLEAIEGLTDDKAKLSLAAAQLMNAVIEERGRDMIKVEAIVEGILGQLNKNLEARTEEETLQAMCSLTGSNTRAVVSVLLSKPWPWDRYRCPGPGAHSAAQEAPCAWPQAQMKSHSAFGAQWDTILSVVQLFTDILEKKRSREDAEELDAQPVAVTCVLCEMLSRSLCLEAVQQNFPRLLLAVLYHLYWVTEQNARQKMAVSREEGTLDSESESFDPASCALEVVKLVLAAADERVVSHADDLHCWDLLSSSTSFHTWVMDLTRAMVKTCDPSLLHELMALVQKSLHSVDEGRKILARAVYAQLLWHPSVGHTLMPQSLGTVTEWFKDPDISMVEISLRGITNLALYPELSEALGRLVPYLRGFLSAEARVAVQALEGLQNIMQHTRDKDIQGMFCSICQHLRPLISDEREPVRIAATSALGHMLSRDVKDKLGATMKRELYTFLVPLLLNMQEENSEVVKACGGVLAEWAKLIGWASLTHTLQHTTLGDRLQVLQDTCAYLVSESLNVHPGDRTAGSVDSGDR
ncbi:maestro heat-like repeat-containing protein family member 7 [Microcebus murinus]|uniref:maestro heat-like repeat-containing protein family member 7 n=1 Tax=Microcebus murinus TaxID=30608 RepID=UPI003F6D68C2